MNTVHSSFEIVVDALTCHLFDTRDDSLRRSLHQLVLVLQEFREERNGVVEDDQVALSHGLEQVLDHDQGRLSRLPLFSSSLHENGVVELDPHGVIVDTVVHLEAEGLDRILDELRGEVGELEHGEEIGDGLAEQLVGVILDEAGGIMSETELESATNLNKKLLLELLRNVSVVELSSGAFSV